MSSPRGSLTPALIRRARSVRLLVLDIDGVMSDGTLLYTDNGSETKRFHALDGQGIKLLQAAGLSLAIISARSSTVVQRRAEELSIAHLVQAAHDKLAALNELAMRCHCRLEECAYLGDDLADVRAMQACGLAFSVPNATLTVAAQAHFVTRRAGGAGAVREVCELLLRAQRVSS